MEFSIKDFFSNYNLSEKNFPVDLAFMGTLLKIVFEKRPRPASLVSLVGLGRLVADAASAKNQGILNIIKERTVPGVPVSVGQSLPRSAPGGRGQFYPSH
jgi:hypothetical protein